MEFTVHILRIFIVCTASVFLLNCSDNSPTVVSYDESFITKKNPLAGKNLEETTAPKQEFDWIGNHDDKSKALIVNTNENFREIVSTTDLSCNFNCNQGVGLLLSYHSDSMQISRCTAFLIQTNVVATNSHCIPKDIKNGVTAYGRMYFILPNQYGFPIEIASLIKASDIDAKDQFSQDYALLKVNLSQPSNKVLKVSKAGVLDAKKYNIPHVNQVKSEWSHNAYSFQVQSVDCEAKQNSPVFPFFDSEHGKIATFMNCPIKEGNSGSPILDKDGNAVAILSAYFRLENTPLGKLMKVDDLIKIPRIALATNFSCIQDFSQNHSLNEECNKELAMDEYYDYYKKLRSEALKKETNEDKKQNQINIDQWLLLNSQIFKWKIAQRVPDSKEKTFELEFFSEMPFEASLDCINPIENWINQYKKMFFFYQNQATVTVKTSLWGTMATVDKDFNFKPEPTQLNDGELKITFNPNEIYKNGRSEVEFVKIIEFSGQKLELSPKKINLELCK